MYIYTHTPSQTHIHTHTELNGEFYSKCSGQMLAARSWIWKKRKTGVTFARQMPHAASWKWAAGDLFQKCSALPLGDQLVLRHFDYNENSRAGHQKTWLYRGLILSWFSVVNFWFWLWNACLMKTLTVLLIWWRWLWKWLHGGKFAYTGNCSLLGAFWTGTSASLKPAWAEHLIDRLNIRQPLFSYRTATLRQ